MISRTVLQRSICPQCQHHHRRVLLGGPRPATARLYPRLYPRLYHHQTSRLYPPGRSSASIVPAHSSLSSVVSIVNNTSTFFPSSSILRTPILRSPATSSPATGSPNISRIQTRHASSSGNPKKPPRKGKKEQKGKKGKKWEEKKADPFLDHFQGTYNSQKSKRSAAGAFDTITQLPRKARSPKKPRDSPPAPQHPSPPPPSPSPPPTATDSSDIAYFQETHPSGQPQQPNATTFDRLEEDDTATQPSPKSPVIALPKGSTRTADIDIVDMKEVLEKGWYAPGVRSRKESVRDESSMYYDGPLPDADREVDHPVRDGDDKLRDAPMSEVVRGCNNPALDKNTDLKDIPMVDKLGPSETPEEPPRKKLTKAAARRIANEERVWEKTGRHLSTSAEIGVTTLGKPAMALIVKARDENTPIPVKNKKRTRKGKKATQEQGKDGKQAAGAGTGTLVIHEEGLRPVADDQPSTVDAMLAESQQYVTEEDIFKNINQLRPPKGTELSQAEYNDTFNLLHGGFTRSQIEHYLLRFPKEAQDPSQTPPWIVSFPQYAPDTKNISRDVEVSRRSPNALTKKDALVIHILTDLWNLTLPGSDSGYLDIRLRDAEFGLLLAGKQRALSFMARFYLTEGGRIEAFPEAKTIRVVAPRKKAYRILDEMNSLLADTDCKGIALSEMPKTATFNKMVKELGRITTTYIRHDMKKKQLFVHWINLSDRPAHLENLRDTVYRFLLSSFYKWPGSSSRLCFWPGAEDHVKGHHFLEPEHERLKWVWHRRLGRWVRWVQEIPVMQREAVAEASDRKPDRKPDKSPVPKHILVKGWDNASAPKEVAYTSSGWSTTLRSTTRATFGHVLIPKTTEALEPPVPSFELQPNPRMLSPVTPPIQSLIGVDDAMGPDDVKLLLRFIPRQSRTSGDARPVDAPPLEVRLEVRGDEVRDPISMRAILADRASDILFPAAVVDARVHQDRYVEFNSHALDSHEKLRKFLSLCQFNMERGNLATPSKVHLPIPRRLFVDRSATPSTEKVPLTESGLRVDASFVDEEVEVEYIFAGMELRRQVRTVWAPGLLLAYTSIEGGKGGGHRAEFSLAIDPKKDRVYHIDHNPLGPRDVVEVEFLREVKRLAEGKAFEWLAVPELE